MASVSKRGQAAGGAAVLLAAIAALIIMFVVLIPPQERAELLGESNASTESTKSTATLETAVPEKNYLTVSPGRIDYLTQKELEHPLPVINIYTRTEAKVLAEKNVAYAKKGVFSEETSTLSFSIPDMENTGKVLLSLNVVNNKGGKLVVSLNGEEVFNAPVKEGSLTPINLPRNLLQEQNVIIIAVSSPGLAFWSTNDLSLSNIKVVADITSIDAQSSSQIFLISEIEKKNLEKIVLKFQPSCLFDEVGKMTISINGRVIYSGVPDCDLNMVPIEFSPTNVYAGENEIIFHTAKGTYLLSHIVIKSELREIEFPTYYFEVSYEEYEQIKDEKMRVRLNMNFVDIVSRKFGDLTFNGNVHNFDTKEVSYTIDLSDDIVRGTNALRINPGKTLDIREVKIDLIK